MTIWHEDRLLIDGELVPAENGATYETIAPGDRGGARHRPRDASVDDADRAIAAARRAFDTTDGRATTRSACGACASSTRRCATTSSTLREILVQEVGAPVSSTSGPQLEGPIEIVRWYADLLERLRVRRRPRRARHLRRPPPPVDREGGRRRRRRDRGVQLPDPARAREARARARGRVHGRAQGRARHAVVDARARQARRRGHRHPARRRERAHVVRQRSRRRADDASRRRRRVVHRLDAGRPPDHGGGERRP